MQGAGICNGANKANVPGEVMLKLILRNESSGVSGSIADRRNGAHTCMCTRTGTHMHTHIQGWKSLYVPRTQVNQFEQSGSFVGKLA